MKYTQGEIFERIKRREKKLKVGDIVKINREVPFQHFEFTDNRNVFYPPFEFTDNRNVFYPPFRTTGEIGRVDRVFEIDIGNNDRHIIPIERLLDLKFSEKISNRIEAKVGFRLENNPNRKIYVVYLIFTFKDKLSEHYGQKDAYGIMISDDIILANETERQLFIEREEKFKAREIAEKL